MCIRDRKQPAFHPDEARRNPAIRTGLRTRLLSEWGTEKRKGYSSDNAHNKKIHSFLSVSYTHLQASGKSTIAKAIYFFRTLKEDIFQLILRRSFSQLESDEKRSSLRSDFESAVRNKFLSTFGTSYSMERDMKVTYYLSLIHI